eukprot:39839-Eustigmatos_ZCMA.PRE.1
MCGDLTQNDGSSHPADKEEEEEVDDEGDNEPITLTEEDLADAPKYLECPISFTVIQDPVLCTDCY